MNKKQVIFSIGLAGVTLGLSYLIDSYVFQKKEDYYLRAIDSLIRHCRERNSENTKGAVLVSEPMIPQKKSKLKDKFNKAITPIVANKLVSEIEKRDISVTINLFKDK